MINWPTAIVLVVLILSATAWFIVWAAIREVKQENRRRAQRDADTTRFRSN
jgi:hypothetical protein